MAKKCPPGVICIENMTVIFLITIVGLVFGYYHYTTKSIPPPDPPVQPIIIRKEIIKEPSYDRVPNVLLNPFTPPLRDGGYFPSDTSNYHNGMRRDMRRDLRRDLRHDMRRDGMRRDMRGDVRRGLPINIRTRGFDDDYRQIGLLTRMNGKETMLPLMGRPLHTNRNKWQFYTMSDKFNSLKLPVSRNGRSCTNEYGCDDLNNGDSVFVEGYNDAFKVTIYDNNQPRYIPYL